MPAHIYRQIIFVLVALAATFFGCAHDDRAADTAPSSVELKPKTQTLAPLVEARRAVYRDGPRSDCAELAPRDAAEHARNWLRAWCHLHEKDWQRAARRAEMSLKDYESLGQVRRQVDLHLLAAIALTHTSDDDAADEHVDAAVRLFSLARISLHGSPSDPFAGDLPYLAGRAQMVPQLRESLRTAAPALSEATHAPHFSPGAVDADLLFATAAWNYRTGGLGEALPHVEFARAERALETGDLRLALNAVEHVLDDARRANRAADMQRALALFERATHLLGLRQLSETVAPWTSEADEPDVSPSDYETEDLTADILRRDVKSEHKREQLVALLRDIRRQPDRAITPPPALTHALEAFDPTPLEQLGGSAWALAHQAGLLLIEQGLRDTGRRYLRTAVASIENIRAHTPTPTLRQQFFADKRPVYTALVDAWVGIDTAHRPSSHYRRAFHLANALKARGLLDLIEGTIQPSEAVAPPPTAHDAPSDLLDVTDLVLKRLARWTPSNTGGRTLTTPPPPRPGNRVSVNRLASRLSEETALVEYLVAPKRSYVWVMTREGLKMRRIAGRETLAPLVDSFVELAADPAPSTAERDRLRTLAERLYVELLGPVEDLVVDHSNLIIAADDNLYELPFEALIRPARGDEKRYVVRDHVISYTPSSAVFAQRDATDDSAPASPRALVMGAPNLDRPALDLLALTPRLPRAGMFPLEQMFPDLPSGRAELSDVARQLDGSGRFQVDLRAETDATESFLRTRGLDTYGLIHLTTHGVSDAEPLVARPGHPLQMTEPALLLSQASNHPDDGVLTLSEILEYRLDADLVVLSGCTTGRGWRTLGAGAYGLAGAFLYTGARNVVASTWSVSDRDTGELMQHVYRALADGKTPAEAMNAGQRAMLKSETPPFYWAAFRVIGS